ncbi:MAG: transcription antitermination factor NusB [Candidatus Gracilibacteria bacterium]|nr:transcription antitermination factor NusB [Candidatus Peregrinibacteria bacterium]
MASYRHLARIAVMQTIFAFEFRTGVDLEVELEHCTEEFANKLKDTDFAKDLLKGIMKEKEDIYKVMQEEAPEWPIERIAPVDRAILAIGIYEIIYSKDVPPIVAINEGVEIAKSYGDLNSAKFINGVLSSVMHKYRPEGAEKPSPEKANKSALEKKKK